MRIQISTVTFVAAFCVLLNLCCMSGCGKNEPILYSNFDSSAELESESEEPAFTKGDDLSSDIIEEPTDIYVYVCGAVQIPGVYCMSSTDRVCDVIEQAKGFTEDAGREYWNLAEPIYDGEKIYVPTVEEVEHQLFADAKNSEGDGTAAENPGITADGKVHLNYADLDQLQTIPGIGLAKAQLIIEYREEHGDFKQIGDIVKVSGIGEATLNRIKDYITVGD